MNILAFNITQFFPSFNYLFLSHIIRKAGFDPKIALFFLNYLVGENIVFLEQFFFFLFQY